MPRREIKHGHRLRSLILLFVGLDQKEGRSGGAGGREGASRELTTCWSPLADDAEKNLIGFSDACLN